MSRFVRWLRSYLQVPSPVRARPAPPRTRRIRLVPCPGCRLLVEPGRPHDCRPRDLGPGAGL